MTNDGKHFHAAICFSSILFDVCSNLLHIFVLLIFLLLVFFLISTYILDTTFVEYRVLQAFSSQL